MEVLGDHTTETIARAAPFVDAIKLGNVSLYEHGWRIIEEVKEVCSRPVIVDLKLMEVPFIAERICRRCEEASADAIMVCGSSGLDTLGFCRAAFSRQPFVVTQFSHCRDVIPDEVANTIIDFSMRLGCDGFQVPGTYGDRIPRTRDRVGESAIIISCGIGRQGPKCGSAIRSGADFEIVGREIYEPSEGSVETAARKVQRNIQRAVEAWWQEQGRALNGGLREQKHVGSQGGR